MPRVRSFAPIVDDDAKVLILGSMPGEMSLLAQQYYAHPRNAFWRIQGELIGAHPALAYADRVRILQAHAIAVWDVLESCVRIGSLDTAIEQQSVVANDFVGLFQRHPKLSRVFFNGAMAERCFRLQVLPGLGTYSLQYQRLPSTSPAHAGMRYADKLDAWRAVIAWESFSIFDRSSNSSEPTIFP